MLDYNEFANNDNSIFKTFYAHPDFTLKNERYHAAALLKIGFLLCEHYSDET